MRRTIKLHVLNEKYKDCPTSISEYRINGNTFIITSHFVGSKDLDSTLYNIAFRRAMADTVSHKEEV